MEGLGLQVLILIVPVWEVSMNDIERLTFENVFIRCFNRLIKYAGM